MTRDLLEISAETLAAQLSSSHPPFLLDVRREDEHATCRLEGAVLIPLHELADRLDELDRTQDTVVYCHHGIRSLNAVIFLQQHGFPNTKSLAGGIDQWSRRVDPSVPLY